MKSKKPVCGAMVFGVVATLSAAAGSASASILIGSDAEADMLVSIDPATGVRTPIGPLSDPIVAGLAYDSTHDILYASSTSTGAGRNLLRVDYTTGAVAVIGPMGQGGMHGIEYNPNRGVLYGVTNGYSSKVWTLDITTGAATAVGTYSATPSAWLAGLAYDYVNDVMYASDVLNYRLFRVDMDTGAITLVGPFNGPTGSKIGGGLAWDPQWGLLATDTHADGAYNDDLYRIDPATGQATLIGSMGSGNMLGLAFVPGPGGAAILAIGAMVGARRRRS